MNSDKPTGSPPAGDPRSKASLRQKAEAQVRQREDGSPERLAELSPENLRTTLHELRVHQIELEMQNEELRRVQAALEAERARYFHIFDLAPVGYVTLDAEGLIVEANTTAANLVGMTRRELIGKTLSHFILREDRDLHYQFRRQLADNGGTQTCEVRMGKTAGTAFWANLSATAVPDPAGGPACRVVLSDISESKKAQELMAGCLRLREYVLTHSLDELLTRALEESELLTGSTIGFFHFVGEDQVTLSLRNWSPNTLRMMGAAQGQELRYPEDWAGAWADALRQRRPVAFNDCAGLAHRKGQPPGHAPAIRMLIVPILRSERVVALLGVGNKPGNYAPADIGIVSRIADLSWDLVQAKRSEEALRESNELQQRLTVARDAAQAAAQAKGLFLANMSHEIRTPLNAILGYAQIMEREDRDSPNSERLRAIIRSGDHLLTLLNQLLELVSSDGSDLAPASVCFDFHRMLEDVRLMFGRRAEDNGVTLEVSSAANVPQFLHADQGKIRQILVNLVGNAMKFTREGGIRVATSVLPPETGDQILLAVDIEDTGCGIGADELERIFGLFEQSASGRRSGTGTGLGLYLSRRYALVLGGEITVTSEPGRGSCFRVTFRAGHSTRGDEAETLRPHVLRLAAGQPPCLILVVDDDQANCDMLSMMLGVAGFAVECADSAPAALDRLERNPPPALVLMDKRMPRMDGYEAIRRLRDLPAGKSLAVLVVTASGFAEERDLARSAGADGYIAKPVCREKLLDEIGRLLGVRYEFEASATPPAPEELVPSPAELAIVPEELRRQFEAALRFGDACTMREVLAEIAPGQPTLAAAMRMLIEAYDYDRLHELLQAAAREMPGLPR